MDTGMLGATGGRLRLPGTKEVKQSISKKRKLEVAKMGGSSGKPTHPPTHHFFSFSSS